MVAVRSLVAEAVPFERGRSATPRGERALRRSGPQRDGRRWRRRGSGGRQVVGLAQLAMLLVVGGGFIAYLSLPPPQWQDMLGLEYWRSLIATREVDSVVPPPAGAAQAVAGGGAIALQPVVVTSSPHTPLMIGPPARLEEIVPRGERIAPLPGREVTRVSFGFDSVRLDAKARDRLEYVARSLSRAGPESYALIHGYADAQGAAVYNQYLSEQRAAAVADYLLELGVAPGKLRTRGLGSTAVGDVGLQESGATVDNMVGDQRMVRVEVVPAWPVLGSM